MSIRVLLNEKLTTVSCSPTDVSTISASFSLCSMQRQNIHVDSVLCLAVRKGQATHTRLMTNYKPHFSSLACCYVAEILVSFSSAFVLWCSSRCSWFGEFLRRQKGIWCLFAWYLRGWSWDGGLSIGRVPAMSCLQATLLRFCRLLQERGTSVLYERTSDCMDRIHIWIHDQRISERYCPSVQSEAACDFKVSFKCRLEVWGFESGPTAVWTPGGSSQTVHLSN